MKIRLNSYTAKNLIEAYCVDNPSVRAIYALTTTGIEAHEHYQSTQDILVCDNLYVLQSDLDALIYQNN